ncbi:MAG: DUF47 family protein [Clostridium sp.]|jgi:uncharacterized protein Yka (UPF0111/DUF47 family)|nr:DUF47 family protein [Clostridium sp.]
MAKKQKGFDYFTYFEDCAGYAKQAAEYLHAALADYDPKRANEYLTVMHKFENDADTRKHEMTRVLVKEFITPIEREDIMALSQNLDCVVDNVEEVMRRVYMFHIDDVRTEAAEFTKLIMSCCEALVDALVEFRSFKRSKTLGELLREVNSIESRGDQLYSRAVRDLYKKESGERQLIIWTKIFDCLEDCLDACEHVADIVESVVVKNT